MSKTSHETPVLSSFTDKELIATIHFIVAVANSTSYFDNVLENENDVYKRYDIHSFLLEAIKRNLI